jgi:hypothetical protein
MTDQPILNTDRSLASLVNSLNIKQFISTHHSDLIIGSEIISLVVYDTVLMELWKITKSKEAGKLTTVQNSIFILATTVAFLLSVSGGIIAGVKEDTTSRFIDPVINGVIFVSLLVFLIQHNRTGKYTQASATNLLIITVLSIMIVLVQLGIRGFNKYNKPVGYSAV